MSRLQLEAALRERQNRTLVLGLPLSVQVSASLFDALGELDAVALQAPGEALWLGLGVAAEVTASGATRFDEVRTRGDALLSACELRHVLHAPRLFGGLAFAPGACDDALWKDFGDARFVLPRWTFIADHEGNAGTLLVAITPDVDAEVLLVQYDQLMSSPLKPTLSEEWALRSEGGESFDAYCERIDAITAAIEDGQAEKIVAARRVHMQADRNLDVSSAFALLGERYPRCARFAFRVGGTTFLGATPERLIRRRGERVDTVALAGTVARGDTHALLTSPKDAREHALVVDAIAEALRPYVDLDAIPETPVVRELPNVLHMQTPIAGQLTRQAHVLTLAEALHPTPAVGGVPRQEAVSWIAEQEAARGWYASPVGSFAADGDGEFFVALRCGVVRGTRADAYAGGGIVAGSNAEAEFRETELKLAPFVDALQGRPRVDTRRNIEPRPALHIR